MRSLDELRWPELAALDRSRTVVFVPVSPMETHGPHLPVGTDLYVARALCERAAAELERRLPDLHCLAVPPVPIGCGVIPMLGSLGVRPRAVRAVVLALGRSLARDGFRNIVVVSGHLGLTHLIALQRAAARVSRRFGVTMLAPSVDVARTVLRGAEDGALFAECDPPLTADELRAVMTFHHAGMLETSLMLHLHPDLVHPDYRLLPPRGRSAYLGWSGRTPGRFQGYVGQPASARADVGAAVVTALAFAAADLVERRLEHVPARATEGATHVPAARARHRFARAGAAAGVAPTFLAAAFGALGLASMAAALTRWRRTRWPGARPALRVQSGAHGEAEK
jgi:creatinine amidohydrolase